MGIILNRRLDMLESRLRGIVNFRMGVVVVGVVLIDGSSVAVVEEMVDRDWTIAD